jgi:ubiquinone biosynthesis protein UbiJ
MARRDLTGAVDFAYLEAYAGGDQQVVDEVLALFREQASMWARLLDPASGDGAWRDAVHTLTPARRPRPALMLGARRLSTRFATRWTRRWPTLPPMRMNRP